MIVISDGDPSPPTPAAGQCAEEAEGHRDHGGGRGARAGGQQRACSNLATPTGGKYYEVKNPKALPRIFQREARRVARPLIYENEGRRSAARSGFRTR